MARGGKRPGSGRKGGGDRVAVLVRLDPELEKRVERERNGKSMSSTVERLIRMALASPQSEDEAADRALGYIVSQAARVSSWQDRTWRNDQSTLAALKLAVPLIVDLLAQPDSTAADRGPHPLFKSTDEHARMIFFWILSRLKERGDEYGNEWPADHPLRNFPRAAAAMNFKISGAGEGGDK